MLELKEVDESFTDFILSLNNDPEFSKSFPREGIITKEQHLNFLKHIKTKGDKYYIIIYNKMPIGTVSIYDIDNQHKRAEWGRFIIVKEYSMLGFNVAKMILKIAFEELKLHKLYCTILSTNTKVIQFNKLLGFKEEGILKDHIFKKGTYINLHFLAKYKD